MFNEKRILITGGTGTVGRELAKGLLSSWNPLEVIIFSRSEIGQVNMKAAFNDPRLNFVIGDIRDEEAIHAACKGVDYIFHLAAIKHVGICENQPVEAVKTNLNGTINLIKAATNNGVSRIINMSTDKAVDPSGTYGHTKAIAERLFIWANFYMGEFINIRSGNVFGSSGSIVPLMINQIKKSNEIMLTRGDMTRYFVSVHDIADFLLKVMQYGEDGSTYIMAERPAFKLRDLAEVIAEKYGNESTVINETGTVRIGEKLHEKLFTEGEKVLEFTHAHEIKKVSGSETSEDRVISKDLLKQWIDDYGRY
jgi:UDP-N-acetylglucosamine 4,6-dehydratase/5-epimerase